MKLSLNNKLRNIKMTKSYAMTSYLLKINQLKDELVAIGDKIEDLELVTVALNGFLSPWEPFIQGICACGKFPLFDDLWDDFVQEENKFLAKNEA